MNIDCNYLVHEREDYIRDIDIYKLGKSGDIFNRMSGYPKGSKLVFMSSSPNMLLVENKLIKVFSTMFIHRTDRGREYFQGDLDTMKKIMSETITYFNKIITVSKSNDIIFDIDQEKRNAGLVIVKYAINYFICKKNKKNFIILKNFIKSSHIITRKNNFLKLKDIRLLWNTMNNTSLSEIELSNLLSPVFGDIAINNGILGWRNKVINNLSDNDKIEEHDNDDDDDDWFHFITKYMIKDKNSFLQWKDLKEKFIKWHNNQVIEKKINRFKLGTRADKAQAYFNKRLGGFVDTTINKEHLRGYKGWRLLI